jgi:hypothetical protein
MNLVNQRCKIAIHYFETCSWLDLLALECTVEIQPKQLVTHSEPELRHIVEIQRMHSVSQMHKIVENCMKELEWQHSYYLMLNSS